MSKRNKNIDNAVNAEVVSIKTGKSIVEVPLDKPDLTLNDEEITRQIAADAELQAKLKAEENAREEQRVAALQGQIDAALKQHQEKASLAFELLKSVMSQKSETVLAGTAFKILVKNIFTLADTFKQEVDDRWTTEVHTLSQNAQSVAKTDETVGKTVN